MNLTSLAELDREAHRQSRRLFDVRIVQHIQPLPQRERFLSDYTFRINDHLVLTFERSFDPSAFKTQAEVIALLNANPDPPQWQFEFGEFEALAQDITDRWGGTVTGLLFELRFRREFWWLRFGPGLGWEANGEELTAVFQDAFNQLAHD